MYAYFVNNRIIKTSQAVNLRLNPAYVPLSEEQAAFLESNPDANVHEVRQCALTPSYTLQPIPLANYKAEKIKEVSDYSLATLGKHVSMYQFANAYISLNGGDIYDTATATEYMNTYKRIGLLCRRKYYELEAAIEGAASPEEVDGIVAAGKEEYDAIR